MPYALKFKSSICYKASQCTDVADCTMALKSLEIYLNGCNQLGLSPPRAYYQRKFSLQKKLKKLFNQKKFKKWVQEKKM